MREGWKIYKLGELSPKITKGTTPTTLGYPFTETGINFIKAESILMDGSIDSSKFVFIDNETHEKLKRSQLEEDDILFSMAGMVLGKSAVVRKEHLPANTNQALAIIRLKKDLALPQFVSYFMRQKSFFDYVNQSTGQSAQPNINLEEIGNLEIEIPSIHTQRRIASLLTALDAKIELNRKTSQTLEAIAQTLFKEWFVDFNFPGATGEIQESELGPIPIGWEVSTLKDLTVKIGSGATPRGGSGVYLDEGTALIRSQNVYDSEFVWDGLARISEKAADQLRNVEVKQEDVLLNITGASILRTCVVEPEVLPARVNQHVSIIRAIPGIPSRYIYLHLLQQKTKDYLMALDAGGSREAVTKGHIESVPILKAPLDVLARFDAVTTPVYSEIEQLASQARSLATLRDSLLPKLMNGEIAV